MKHGQWQERIESESESGERWVEILNKKDNYWERKSDFYIELTKNKQNLIDLVLVGEGRQELKNNKGFEECQVWRQYSDG